MLIVHDYGFADEPNVASDYEEGPPFQPSFVDLELPVETGFPRGFFRVFGNEPKRVVQITNDVNFAELAATLGVTGDVLTLPHGNQLAQSGVALARGQGVFLAELGLLEPGDDLPALLEQLRERQAEAREGYAQDHVNGHRSLFMDLVYVKR